MALKNDLQLTVKKADGSTLALNKSGGANASFAFPDRPASPRVESP